MDVIVAMINCLIETESCLRRLLNYFIISCVLTFDMPYEGYSRNVCVCGELDIYVFTIVLQLDVNTFQKDVRENRRGNQDNREILVKPKGQSGQSRDSGNIGHTRHRTKTNKSQKHNITHTTKKMNSTE